MINLAVFASGNGSNFQSLVDSVNENKLGAKIVILVCDKADAYVINRAEKAGIKTFVFNPKDYKSKSDYEQEIINQLKMHNVDFIALAGYMRLVGKVLLSQYEGKIINIHPSLLPAFKGLDAIGQAIDYGVRVMGVTIHYVDEGMDTGKIISQDSFRLTGIETKAQIEAQVHAIEHRLYPQTLRELFNKI